MRVAVVIPCFKVKQQILAVVAGIGPEVWKIYVVDDACPQKTGEHVLQEVIDPRVEVIFNGRNLGVGGAVLNGYLHAIDDGAEIIVKLDGDGQMDSRFIPALIRPIEEAKADYTKGNRFFSPDNLVSMPWVRLIGNSALSFINKAVSGYWNTMDPTNGFTAIHANVVRLMPIKAIAKRYFFESDMLFRLGTFRAVVHEVPMKSIYQSEKSNLSVGKTLLTFPMKFLRRFVLRIGYNYFVRDFNVLLASVVDRHDFVDLWRLVWYHQLDAIGRAANCHTDGYDHASVLPIIMGFQLLLAAISFDVANIPKNPVYPALDDIPPESTGSPEIRSPRQTTPVR